MTATYSQQCSECGETYQAYRRRKALSACDKAACLASEATRHNAAVAERRAVAAATPRAPRVKRQPVALYGDAAWIAAVNGLRTDGTGRRAR